MHPENLLKKNHLCITPVRKRILSMLMNNENALSRNYFNNMLQSDFNRSTIYRTLKTLTEAGIIHKIMTLDNDPKFSLNASNFSNKAIIKVHFHCTKCQKVFCIEIPQFDEIKLPEGFQLKEKKLMIEGTCNHCN